MALPQRHRLKGQRVFDSLYRQGRATHGPFLMLRWQPARADLLPPGQRNHAFSPWRCGVVISTKVHKRSVQRNRLRRLLHGHLIQQPIGRDGQPVWLLLSLRPGCAERSSDALLEECQELLHRAGLIR
ncbi:ribonuclease P protein component [Cyanobium sp. NIES-981]|uniref:ribonuclease P protein component n=1 Tax=Cyanobium sp. NIES-981 TaxID=1851505 RepID=UPI0007DD9CC1|nr:ribonuclease P protein component [Cyanobium sp. NIES-981]SBO43037.1 Ribonuclease P protein component [Cyanobium sp. NIES-981]